MAGVNVTVIKRAPASFYGQLEHGMKARYGERVQLRKRATRLYVLPQWNKADPPRASVPLSTCLEFVGMA